MTSRYAVLPACTLASANTSSGPDTSSNWTPGVATIATVLVLAAMIFRVSVSIRLCPKLTYHVNWSQLPRLLFPGQFNGPDGETHDLVDQRDQHSRQPTRTGRDRIGTRHRA